MSRRILAFLKKKYKNRIFPLASGKKFRYVLVIAEANRPNQTESKMHIAPFYLPVMFDRADKSQYVSEIKLMSHADLIDMILGGHIDMLDVISILLIDPNTGTTKTVTNEIAFEIFDYYDNNPDDLTENDVDSWLNNLGHYTDHLKPFDRSRGIDLIMGDRT